MNLPEGGSATTLGSLGSDLHPVAVRNGNGGDKGRNSWKRVPKTRVGPRQGRSGAARRVEGRPYENPLS